MRVHLLTVPTGRLGAKLPVVDGSWDWPAGAIPELRVTCDATPWLDGALPDPLPWQQGLSLILDDGNPWVAGPITELLDEGTLVTDGTVKLSGSGIEGVLAGWIVLPTNYTDGAALTHDAPLTITADSWGTIAARLVQSQVARCGQLPIVYGSNLEPGTRYTRTYQPWNLANNGLWKRLTELQGLNEAGGVPGPDMSFRPEWSSPNQNVRWRMLWGTSAQAALPQTWRPVIDLTSTRGPVASWSPISAWEPSTRVYGIGAGQEAGQLVSIGSRPELTGRGMPPRETVMNDTSNDVLDLLTRRTDARAAQHSRPRTQITVTLDANDPRTRLGAWTPGHVAQVTIGDRQSVRIPAGTREWRCVRMQGTIGSSKYVAELQEV